jgi:hypothetical protein
MKSIFLAFALLMGIVGCDQAHQRADAKSSDFTVTIIEHDGCEYEVWKFQKGQIWETASVVHYHKCKACKR